ncbi:Lrp/AsnC family transcriptional regulator [Candidatus Methylomicrobium oryzae]|uniref:Lrp/AsnC family transcriptional regulator n=1 Tax=Candidatus Methylomicrobium oryzae TaxID=2802053 RepID=UPI001921CA6B|nr:Lrp/AsnC family transcriptional regulator [Methylomicrobium sp. RS1]MBL1265454.1 Lrp/AsnC family transcriptional regulator [Methylomicrobium sp. RS1]
MLTDLHKQLLNDFQRDFPLVERPYLEIANRLGVSEDEVLSALAELRDNRLISRVGPVIPPNQIGASMLVAMAVPEPELQRIADIVSRFPEVNHNYEREHRFNLWFVAVASTTDHLARVLDSIERETGYLTQRLPLVNDFFIDLGFRLDLSHA